MFESITTEAEAQRAKAEDTLATAEANLERVLQRLQSYEFRIANEVMDQAMRLLDAAAGVGPLGPLALTLAAAQMAVDLARLPLAEEPRQSPLILLSDGETPKIVLS